jgi:hypothetical protein
MAKEWREQDPVVVRGFELYVEFGTSRKVANALASEGVQVSHMTVSRWVNNFGWTEKRERLLACGPSIAKEYSVELAKGDTAIRFSDSGSPLDQNGAQAVKSYYAKILFDMAEDFIDKFKRGEVGIDKFSDFEKAVKMIAVLKGIDLTQPKKSSKVSNNTINLYGNMSDSDVKKKLAQLRGDTSE